MSVHRITTPQEIGVLNKQVQQQVQATSKELKNLRVLTKQVHKALTTVQGQQVLQNTPGPLPLNGNFTVNSSGPVMIFVSGSGFVNGSNGAFTLNISVDGTQRGTSTQFTNETSSHKALPTAFLVLNLAAGSHLITLSAGANMTTNSSDFFNIAILELQANV